MLIFYILLTTLFLLVGSFKGLEGSIPHYLIRLVLLLFILFIGYFDQIIRDKNVIFDFFRSFYPLLLLALIYKETGFLNKIFFTFFDPFFVELEEKLWHIQPSLIFSEVLPQKWFGEIMSMGYFSFYFLVFGLSFFAWWNDRKRGRVIISIVMASFLYYYLIFVFLPVEGPQYYFATAMIQGEPHGLFPKLVYFAQEIGETTTGAFPSSHVGISLIILYLSFRYARKIFPVILIFCLILWPATVYVKAHYVVDLIGGFLSAPIIFVAARWTDQKLSKKTKSTQPLQ